jgi:hypothetical protein
MDKPSRESGAQAPGLTRRTLLQKAAGLGLAASTLGALDALARVPRRAPAATPSSLPDIQFAIGDYIPPAVTLDGVPFRFGPVYTMFATIELRRGPTKADQAALASALATIEANYPFRPEGVFTFVSYGIPYFERLPGGMGGPLVSAQMPRLLEDPARFALEEAVPGPTDVSTSNPGITKATFNVPVRIDANDMLVTLRSDSTAILDDVLVWLVGGRATLNGNQVGRSGLGRLLRVTSRRLMFQQRGLPRKVASEHRLGYARSVNPESPMWMGFADQQVAGSGPPEITTFAGNSSAKLTTAVGGSYFDNGAVVHLSHVIQDLAQFYARPGEPYTERAQYMFRSNPIPSTGYADQYANGGGPSYLPNVFQGPGDAAQAAAGLNTYEGKRRIGHVSALQRSSRAADGTPIHIRADGPGFDSLDVPDGSRQPKLQFSIFVPTAEFFRTMRRNQASQDLAQQFSVPPDDNGLERFITATRRQNFLVPPRRHRAFPLLELT